MNKAQTEIIQTEIPVALLAQAEDLVNQGWFSSLDDVLLDALRRYLESHRADLMEAFIHQDVAWGLVGNDCSK
jgi:Arc/MetJ-type ribon-helix-helix transcriptional regulator